MTFSSDLLQHLPDLLRGVWISIQLVALALVIGLPLGLILAIGTSSRTWAIRAIVIAVTEIGRGIPALVVLQLFYFGLPVTGLQTTSFVAAALALAVTAAAYTSEIIRGGLQAVPQGEVEATQALGMNRRDALRFVVIPQGIRIAIPALMGFGILLFQATSLAYTIAVPELTSRAYGIGAETSRYLGILVIAGLFYAVVSIPASFASDLVSRRLSRHL